MPKRKTKKQNIELDQGFEEWRDVLGFSGYQVSNRGAVRSFWKARGGPKRVRLPSPRLMNFQKTPKGYETVALYSGGKQKRIPVHRLVATAFIPNQSGKPQINHIDCDKSNNDVANLEWVTCRENIRHAIKAGVRNAGPQVFRGEDMSTSIFKNEDVLRIYGFIESGMGCKEISLMFGCSRQAISSIKHGYTWKHLRGIYKNQKATA